MKKLIGLFAEIYRHDGIFYVGCVVLLFKMCIIVGVR